MSGPRRSVIIGDGHLMLITELLQITGRWPCILANPLRKCTISGDRGSGHNGGESYRDTTARFSRRGQLRQPTIPMFYHRLERQIFLLSSILTQIVIPTGVGVGMGANTVGADPLSEPLIRPTWLL